MADALSASIFIGEVVSRGTPGSILYVDSNGRAAQDNASLFFEPSTSTFGTINAKFKGPRPWIDVTSYGADPTGVSDSTSSIQNAVNAAIAVGANATVFFPPGNYKVSSEINCTHSGSFNVNLVGQGAVLVNASVSQIQSVIKVGVTSSKAGNRIHRVISGLSINGNGNAFAGIFFATAVGGDGDFVTVSDVYVTGCFIGLDLLAISESQFSSISLYNNTGYGLRLINHPTTGGGNSNEFYSVKITGGPVGILVRQDAVGSLLMEENSFLGVEVEANTVAGILVIGSSSLRAQRFLGAYFENGVTLPAPGSTAVVNVGYFGVPNNLTVNTGDIVVYSAKVSFSGSSDASQIYGLAQSTIEAGDSALPTLEFEDANAGSPVTAFSKFGQLNVRGTELSQLPIYATRAVGAPKSTYDCYIMEDSPKPTSQPNDANYANQFSSAAITAAAVLSKPFDSQYGTVDSVAFAASPGANNTNSYKITPASQLPFHYYLYFSILVKSTTNTSLKCLITGTSQVCNKTITLVANQWQLLRLTSEQCGILNTYSVQFFPTGSDGPTVSFAQPYLANAPDIYTAGYLTGINASGRISASFSSLAVGEEIATQGVIASILASTTIPSAAGATWDGIRYTAPTVTVTGNTNITTAAGFNFVTIGTPTISAASALTVTNAASLTIIGAPVGAGAGPATITNAYALWVQSGAVKFGSGFTCNGSTLTTMGVGTGQVTLKTFGGSAANQAPVLSIFRSGLREGIIAIAGTSNQELMFGNTGGLANYQDASINAGCQWKITATGGWVATGNFRMSYGTSALATTATDGFFHLQSCAGAPTGVPASIPTGQIPWIIDSTNKKLYAYIAAAWTKAQVAGVDVIFG